MKRAGGEQQPAVISRRYNDFCYLYERILCTFHPSILGEFQFPKKVLIGNFKAEVITERTDAFHKFLNLIAQNDKVGRNVRNSDVDLFLRSFCIPTTSTLSCAVRNRTKRFPI